MANKDYEKPIDYYLESKSEKFVATLTPTRSGLRDFKLVVYGKDYFDDDPDRLLGIFKKQGFKIKPINPPEKKG